MPIISLPDITAGGSSLREFAKLLVKNFFISDPRCAPAQAGVRTAEIFRLCGLDWGDKPRATSSNQQYWLVAILQELAEENLIERLDDSGPWRRCR